MNKLGAVVLGIGLMVALGAQALAPEVRTIRRDALATLSRALSLSPQTLNDAMLFLEKELDPAVHQKLLEYQAQADELDTIKIQMLAIPGVTADAIAVKSVDAMLDEILRKFNDLLYNDGVFSWRTVLSLGAGMNVGLYSGATFKKPAAAATITHRAWHGLWVGLLAAMLLEFSLRGRKAIIAGSVHRLISFVLEVSYKFLRAMFGRSSVGSSLLASVEAQLRSSSVALDRLLNNRLGVGSIVVVSAVVAGIMYRHYVSAVC